MTWAGPLQQLGVCLMLGAVIATLLSRWQTRLAAGMTLLLVTGGLLAWCPFPGDEQGRLEVDQNLAAFVDRMWLPGRTHFADWDPHGILTTLPALAVLLFGAAAGTFLLNNRTTLHRVIPRSLIIAFVCVNGGLLLNAVQPCNRYVMTPAFILIAVGLIHFVFACAFAIDTSATAQRIAFPIQVFGRNSLLLVVVLNLHSLTAISDVFVGGDVGNFLGGVTPLCRVAIELAALWGLAWLLFRRKVFVTL